MKKKNKSKKLDSKKSSQLGIVLDEIEKINREIQLLEHRRDNMIDQNFGVWPTSSAMASATCAALRRSMELIQ